jgi:uncharacterized protein YjiS (DUF1127 family)
MHSLDFPAHPFRYMPLRLARVFCLVQFALPFIFPIAFLQELCLWRQYNRSHLRLIHAIYLFVPNRSCLLLPDVRDTNIVDAGLSVADPSLFIYRALKPSTGGHLYVCNHGVHPFLNRVTQCVHRPVNFRKDISSRRLWACMFNEGIGDIGYG